MRMKKRGKEKRKEERKKEEEREEERMSWIERMLAQRVSWEWRREEEGRGKEEGGDGRGKEEMEE